MGGCYPGTQGLEGRHGEDGTKADSGGGSQVEQQPRSQRQESKSRISPTPLQPFWAAGVWVDWEDSSRFIRRHLSQSPIFPIKGVPPKVSLCKDCSRKTAGDGSEASGAEWAHLWVGRRPASGQPARKGRRKILWAVEDGPTPAEHECFVCSR